MNQKLIERIREDIDRCRSHAKIEGSQKLFGELLAKYSEIIPEFEKNLSTNGKAALVGAEFDYRPELNAIAAKLEMYLLTNSIPEADAPLESPSKKIDDTFISYASDILGETNSGLSGSQIVKYCNSYAIDFAVTIPVSSPDFGKFGSIVPNKRTALYRNLSAFDGPQQFTIIKELCELPLLNTIVLLLILRRNYSADIQGFHQVNCMLMSMSRLVGNEQTALLQK